MPHLDDVPEPAATARTLVVGLGNPILGDDGIGWRVAEAVQSERPGVEVDCLSLGGLSLMERLIGYRRVIIVDAIQTGTGAIGQVHGWPLAALPDRSAGHTTAAHDTSLPTALRLGLQMGADLPSEIYVVAVEAERVYDFSDDLSVPVAAAIPEAVARVLAQLDAWERTGGSPGATAGMDEGRGVLDVASTQGDGR